MCVLYVSYGSKVMPSTFGCVAMRSAVLFILRSRSLLYSTGTGVKRVQVILSVLSVRSFSFVQAATLCRCGGMSAVYMLNSVGERTPPCRTPVLN